MRKCFLTLAIVGLGLATIASSACKFSTGTNSNNSGGNNNNGAASPSPSPSAPKNAGTSTPEETFKTFFNALKNKDVAALKSVMPKKTLDEMAEDAKKKNKSLDDFIRDEVISDMSHKLPDTLPEIRNVKIDGDRASMEYLEDGDWKTGHMIKEDGSWKLS